MVLDMLFCICEIFFRKVCARVSVCMYSGADPGGIFGGLKIPPLGSRAKILFHTKTHVSFIHLYHCNTWF